MPRPGSLFPQQSSCASDRLVLIRTCLQKLRKSRSYMYAYIQYCRVLLYTLAFSGIVGSGAGLGVFYVRWVCGHTYNLIVCSSTLPFNIYRQTSIEFTQSSMRKFCSLDVLFAMRCASKEYSLVRECLKITYMYTVLINPPN